MQNPASGTNESQETIYQKATLQKRNREDKNSSRKHVCSKSTNIAITRCKKQNSSYIKEVVVHQNCGQTKFFFVVFTEELLSV